MRLAGDLADFSLADLIQVHALAGKTCAIKVTGPTGGGAVYLRDGGVCHSSLGTLQGEDALVALLARLNGYFEVQPDAVAPRRTIDLPLSRLLLIASERIARGDVPPAEATSARPRAVEARPSPGPGPAAPAARRRVPAHRLLLTGAAVLVFGVVGTLALSSGSRGPAAPASSGDADAESASSRAIEARELNGPGDAQPLLLEGEAPASPDPSFALDPTVVCRLLIDAEGHVAEAKIYRSRVELALFEEEALSAVRRYRFQPALRAGSPAPVWTNWTVSFRQP